MDREALSCIKLRATRVRGKRLDLDCDSSKGCDVCVAECPCGAIDMIPEEV